MILAEGIAAIDAEWLRNMAIFIAASLAAAAYVKKLFFEKPPLAIRVSEDQQKVLNDLKTSLAGLAPNEKVDKLVGQLGSFATQQQIREIELKLPELVKREELERCMDSIKKDLNAQLKENRDYTHKEVHDVRDDLQAMRLESNDAREGIHDRIGALVKVTYQMRGMLAALTGKEIDAL